MSQMDNFIMAQLVEDVSGRLTAFRDCMAILGLLYASKVTLCGLYQVARAVRVYVLPRIWSTTDLAKVYGEWAVVTGASEGIGRAYALKLAKRKMNVFIISRSEEKLTKVCREIESLGVKAAYMALDMNEMLDEEVYQKLENNLRDLDIGILVNNVGLMYDRLQYFLTVPNRRLKEIVNLNVTATVLMTKMVLPSMVTKKRGAIINVCSGAQLHPTPLMTHYSASKRFVDLFTRALEYEYRDTGIQIQSINPFYVSTNMTSNASTNIFMQSADNYTESAIRTLGTTRRCYGHWFHALFGWVGEWIPERLYMFSAFHVNPPLWRWMCNTPTGTNKNM